MTIGTTPSRITTRQRKVPRYKLAVPLGLTVLRAGMPDKIPGSTTRSGKAGWASWSRHGCCWESRSA